MPDDPFVKPPDLSTGLSDLWGFFTAVITTTTTIAALSADKIKLGPIGTFLGAMGAFNEIRSIETGMDLTTDDPKVKEIIGKEGINEKDAKDMMVFPLNLSRLQKLVDTTGGVGWQADNMIYAWHKNSSFIPIKTGRIVLRKNDQGNVELRVHPRLLQNAGKR